MGRDSTTFCPSYFEVGSALRADLESIFRSRVSANRNQVRVQLRVSTQPPQPYNRFPVPFEFAALP